MHLGGVQEKRLTRLKALSFGAGNTSGELAALSRNGTEGRFVYFYPGIGVLTMPTASPKAPATYGSGEDLLLDLAADIPAQQETLTRRILDLLAILHGLRCMASFREQSPGRDDNDHMECLAEIGKRLGAEAFALSVDLEDLSRKGGCHA